MRNCNQLDLIVRDVPAATAFFRDVVGLPVRVEDARFAELDGGAIMIMLSPDALVPVQEAAGVILHIQVDDVEGALERARRSGAAVLLEPTRTDWGTESAMIAGPEGIIVDFYRQVGPHQPEAAS
ncbi:MAG: VOC family protein [Oscillochloridaceae bacterium]|nr:VOC family protein [Chloroflexaceae bacterium]MDW8390606.1 VOC family protein [Oscillochloridaceae bacterium]